MHAGIGGAGIRAVIFDVGRVLVRIVPDGEKFAALMREVGVAPADAFAVFWNEREVAQHMRGELDSREFHRLARERFHLSLDFDHFAEAWCDIFRPDPEMERLFRLLEGRFRLGLLSDTDPLHWNRLLRDFPWLGRVGRPTLSHLTGWLKPHPEAFRRAVADCGAERPEECLFIDDLPANVGAAADLGLMALRFSGAAGLERDLRELGLL